MQVALKINTMLVPKGTKARPGTKITPKYVTIHETANTRKGADANAHARLQYNGNDRAASWHYSVDDKEIWQSIPEKEKAWHAGTSAGNSSSIAIEICVNSDGNFAKAKKLAAQLAAELLNKYKLPISRLVQHNYWSGKNCPAKLRKSGWSAFKKDVEDYMKGKKPEKPKKWDGKSFPGRSAFKIGKSHPAVTVLGKRLVSHGFGKHYKVGPGPTFSEADRKNVQDFQKSQGWKGADADGYPGPVTWERLMKDPKKKKPNPKPKQTLYRVYRNGKKVGAYKEHDNIVKQAKESIKKGEKEFKIEKVVL